ncbi:hypothetical protein Q0590_24810 [Rhodocytophaga aerolata]|uniref:Uncharacterized protein n=1 Tax=Rhodocytophaga aerolata TaxID=455078 RepID=A0ABT8RBP0_9BACT|nr:hypothetical protein [Rhodocytophaga aerolata]MDO1449521.1 hypothetical protein [Rhodocytophaga aerolata]
MPAPKKYRHQAQLDSLFANQGIRVKSFPEELQDEIKEWNRAWVEKGKPNENKELTSWSNEISAQIDEHLSQFDVSLEEEEEVMELIRSNATIPAPVETEQAPVIVPVTLPVETPIETQQVQVIEPATLSVETPKAATKQPRQKLSERMSGIEKALERLYDTGKVEYSKAELIQAGFDPGFFGWTSTGWHNGKFFDVKKPKKSTAYTIVKL